MKQTITIPAGIADTIVTVDTVITTDIITPPPNSAPTVSAGGAQTITLPVNSVVLDGSASDPDGTIVAYKWEKISGGIATILNATAENTQVNGLTQGSYQFRLTVTDNGGATASSVATVTVNPAASINQPPIVNAGNNQTITLPVSSVSLVGVASDPDGTIASYQWSKTSGPTSGTIVSPTTVSTSVTGLTAGGYVFTLQVADNQGATKSDFVNITVNPSVPPPPPSGNLGILLYSNGFNTTNDLDPFGHGQIGNGSLSTTNKVEGAGSFKSVPANVSSGIRSEVQLDSAQTPLEGAVEYDVYYETIFQNSGHSLQFHPNTSGGSASPGLWHENGQFVWVNWKGGTNTKYATNFTIPRNKWLHVIFQYKIGSAGYMKFTVDGAVLLDRTGIQVGDGSGQWLKVGVNMWVNQTSVVYYDNLKIYKK